MDVTRLMKRECQFEHKMVTDESKSSIQMSEGLFKIHKFMLLCILMPVVVFHFSYVKKPMVRVIQLKN